MRLILIRHGQTPANVAGILESTVPGPGLTALGDDEAAVLPTTLADEKIQAIFASTQVRSQLTAAPLSEKLGISVEVRGGIREIDSGDLEGRTDRPSIISYVTTFLRWVGGELDVRMPGAEDGREALARYDGVVAEAEALGHDTVAFVSHGAIIRAWVGCRTSDLSVEFLQHHYVMNTGYVILTGSTRDGWNVESWQGGGVFDAAINAEQDESPASDTLQER